MAIRTINSSIYNVKTNDDFVNCNCANNNITVNLYDAGLVDNNIVTIKKNDIGTNSVSVEGYTISKPDGYVTFRSIDGSWEAIDIDNIYSNTIKSQYGTIFDGFSDDFASRTVSNATIERDIENFRSGEGGLRIIGRSFGNSADITYTNTFDLDSMTTFSMDIYIKDTIKAPTTSISLQFFTSLGNRFVYNVPSQYLSFRKGWNTISVDRDDITVFEGAPSWDDITYYTFKFQNATTVDLTIDSLRYNDKNRKAVILFFDDAHETFYTTAFPILQQYNVKGVLPVSQTYVDQANYMTLSQIREVREAGVEIVNHSFNHSDPTTKNYEELYDEVRLGIDYLQSKDINDHPDLFVYANGTTDDYIEAARNNGIKLARGITTRGNDEPIENILNIEDISLTNLDFTDTAVSRYFDKILAGGGILSFRIHRVTSVGDGILEVPTQTLIDLIKFCQGNNIDIITFSDYQKLYTPELDIVQPEIVTNDLVNFELFDDFLYQTITEADTPWILNSGADAQALDPAINIQKGGVIRLTTGDADGTVANDGSQIVCFIPVQAIYGGLIVESRLHINTTVEDVSLNFGLTDVTTLEEPFEIGSSDIITSNASDACCFVYDTNADTKEWFACCVDSDTDDTANGATGIVPEAGRFQNLKIEVGSNGAEVKFYINNVLVKTLNTAGVTSSVNLYATIIASSTTTTSKTIDVDYIKINHVR